jgi:hypothetical protein
MFARFATVAEERGARRWQTALDLVSRIPACWCRLLAQMRSADRVRRCLLIEVDRTYGEHHETDAIDPKETFGPPPHDRARPPRAVAVGPRAPTVGKQGAIGAFVNRI